MDFREIKDFPYKSGIMDNIGENKFFPRCPRAAEGLGHALIAPEWAKIFIYGRNLTIFFALSSWMVVELGHFLHILLVWLGRTYCS